MVSTVWHFNRNIPGLRLWALSFFFAAVFSFTLLVRDHIPEVLSVVLVQATSALTAFLAWLGSRACMRRPASAHWYAAAAVGAAGGHGGAGVDGVWGADAGQ